MTTQKTGSLTLRLRWIAAASAVFAMTILIPLSAGAEDKFPRTYDPVPESVFTPPQLPDPLDPWPPVEVLYECTLHPVSEREYIMLEAVTFHSPTAFSSLPQYLIDAINQQNTIEPSRAAAAGRPPMEFGVEHILRFISYRDMTQLVLLMNRDARTFQGIFKRHHWVEEISGIEYTNDGVPLRNDRGEYTFRRQTTWMDEAELREDDEVVPRTLVDSVVQGLYNSDPRVRLQALSILNELGPSPYIQQAVREAGGLIEGGLETVGDVGRGWFSTAAITQEQIDEARSEREDGSLPTGAGRLLTRRYVYCDIDGLPHWAVPHYQFVLLNRKIERIRLSHRLEIRDNLGPDLMRVIDAESFLTMTDSIEILGAYGVNRATNYWLAPHRSPFSGRIYRGDREYDGYESEFDDNISAQQIPAQQYVRNQSYFKKYAPRILMPMQPPITPELVRDTNMESRIMRSLITSFFGALENRNFLVRRRAADFLYDLYRAEVLEPNNQRLILNATLHSIVLRETMKEEFIPRVRVMRLHQYLAWDDFNELRTDILGYDREYGDLFLEPYNRRPEINRIHTPAERRRFADGTLIGTSTPETVAIQEGRDIEEGRASGEEGRGPVGLGDGRTPGSGDDVGTVAEIEEGNEDQELANEFEEHLREDN